MGISPVMIRQKEQLEAFISEKGARIVQRGAPDKEAMITGKIKTCRVEGFFRPRQVN